MKKETGLNKYGIIGVILSVLSMIYLFHELYLKNQQEFYVALISIVLISGLISLFGYILCVSSKKKMQEKYEIGDKVRYSHSNPIGEIIEDGDTYVIVKTKLSKHLVTKID